MIHGESVGAGHRPAHPDPFHPGEHVDRVGQGGEPQRPRRGRIRVHEFQPGERHEGQPGRPHSPAAGIAIPALQAHPAPQRRPGAHRRPQVAGDRGEERQHQPEDHPHRNRGDVGPNLRLAEYPGGDDQCQREDTDGLGAPDQPAGNSHSSGIGARTVLEPGLRPEHGQRPEGERQHDAGPVQEVLERHRQITAAADAVRHSRSRDQHQTEAHQRAPPQPPHGATCNSRIAV